MRAATLTALLLAAMVAAAAAEGQKCGSPGKSEWTGVCRQGGKCADGFQHGDALAQGKCDMGEVCCVERLCGSADVEGTRLSRCRTEGECAAAEGTNTGDHGCAALGPALLPGGGDSGRGAPVCCQAVSDCGTKRASPFLVAQMARMADELCTLETLCQRDSDCDKLVREMMVMKHWCGDRYPSRTREYLAHRETIDLLLVERLEACGGMARHGYHNPFGAGRFTREQLLGIQDRYDANFRKWEKLTKDLRPGKWDGTDEQGVASMATAADKAAKSLVTKHSLAGKATVINKLDLVKVDVTLNLFGSFGGGASFGGGVNVRGQVGPDFFHVYAGATLTGQLESKKIGTLFGLAKATGVTIWRAVWERADQGMVKSMEDVEDLLARAKQSFERKHRDAANRLETRVEELYERFIGDVRKHSAAVGALINKEPNPTLDKDPNDPHGNNRPWYDQETCKEGREVLQALLRASPDLQDFAHFKKLVDKLAVEIAVWYDVTDGDAVDNKAWGRFRERLFKSMMAKLKRHYAYLDEIKRMQTFISMDPKHQEWCPPGVAGKEALRKNHRELQRLLDDAIKATKEIRLTPAVALKDSGALTDLRRFFMNELRKQDWSEWGDVDADLTLKISLQVEAGFQSDPGADHWMKALTGDIEGNKWNVGAFGGFYWSLTAKPYAALFEAPQSKMGGGGGIVIGGAVGAVEVELKVAAHTDGGFAELSFSLPATVKPGEFVTAAWAKSQMVVDVSEVFVKGYQRIMRGDGVAVTALRTAGDAFERLLREVGQEVGDVVLASWLGTALSKAGVSSTRKFSVQCKYDLSARGIELSTVDVAFVHGITVSFTDDASPTGKIMGKLKGKAFSGTYAKEVSMQIVNKKG